MFRFSFENVTSHLQMINNLAVTTRITISKNSRDLFLKDFFETEPHIDLASAFECYCKNSNSDRRKLRHRCFRDCKLSNKILNFFFS